MDFFSDIKENRRSPSMPARMARMLKGLALRKMQRHFQNGNKVATGA
jgi:hypothetical protein